MPSNQSFNYDINFTETDFRLNPELYRIGKGEQGVLLVQPYKNKILPHWKFKTPEIASASSTAIYALFLQYKKEQDFIGMDMARKFIQMGYTRSRRYANHKSGKKYDGAVPMDKKGQSGAHGRQILPNEKDEIKAQSAAIFYEVLQKVKIDKTYRELKEKHIALVNQYLHSTMKFVSYFTHFILLHRAYICALNYCLHMKKIITSLLFFCCLLFAQAQSQSINTTKKTAFISNLMTKMTVDEKIGQLNLVTPGGAVTGSVVSSDVDEKIRKGLVGGLFGITGPATVRKAQEIAVNNSRLHIPLIFGLDVIHGHRTIFPIPLGLSCSWDTAMIEKSAAIAAKEATADGLNWAFSPMVDIARDPRWGRVSEGSGEDPYLGGKIAAAMVRGYQGKSYDSATHVMACVKHFALYGAAEGGREYNTTDMSRIKMYEYYLPPYKAAVDAGVGSVMSSFNEVDAIPATGNQWLLTDLLRKQWGFKGFVVSDYTAVSEMTAHGMGDLKTISALALKAGLDMDMVSEGFLNTLKQSLQNGKITQLQIDAACRRILEAKYDLGLFADPYRYMNENRPATDILTDSTRAAARMFAEHSIVLLKNANQTLPLKKSGTIALIGPLAESQRNMLGTWSVSGDWKKSVSIATGIKNVAGNSVNILYAKGANISDDSMLIQRTNVFGTEIETDPRTPQQMLDEAVNLAKNTDVVVAVLGEAADMTGESSSMSNIGLPESQENLLKALVATGKPVVLVLLNGRPMTLTWEDAHVAAIADAWFCGTEAGNAIADVLFGNYNPSAKLTMSFPRNAGQIPVYYNHKNTGRPFIEGQGSKFKSDYLDVSNDPLYPFGYGLSYTNFTYSNVTLNKATVSGNQSLQATVTVTNTGTTAGEETVQLYISQPAASITRAVEDLKGFQKITLQPGESKPVSFTISPNDLKFYNSNLKYDWEGGHFIIHIGPNSRDVKSVPINWSK